MKRILSTLLILIIAVSSQAQTTYTLNHPCLLYTQDDFDYVKAHLGEEPYASALIKLKNSSYCKTSYKPSPVEYLARLDATNWGSLNSRWENAGIADLWYEGIHNNYTYFMRDAAAAYQLALLYKLENNTQAAAAAKNIIVQWSTVNKGLLRNTQGEIVDPNEKLIMFQPYQMAIAAEMLRDYNNWGGTDEFKAVVRWFDNSFYGESHAHLELQNSTGGGHYWMNWDLAAMTSILAIGILADNQDYINEAIMYYKGNGGGPGNISKGVPFLHEDSDSDEMLGQGNEAGRDQGHNTLCVAVLGVFCKMGLTLGDDLFAYDNYRAMALAEYVAKYNLAKESFYPDPMQNFSQMRAGENDGDFEYAHAALPFSKYTYGDKGTMTAPSQDSRGTVRPGWDSWVGYANSHGLSAIYAGQMAERIRPDGGGGHYSGNSGGFDQLGFSTLMEYRPFVAIEEPDSASFVCVADTWVREDAQGTINGGGEKVELRSTDKKNDAGEVVGKNFHVGLMGFKFNLPEDKKVEKAVIKLITERVKGNTVSIYAYPDNFDENTACWNTEREYIATAQDAAPLTNFTAAGQKGKSIYDGGITADRQNLGAWTNEIDVTDYVASLPPDTKRVNFMLIQDGDQVCFFSKDNKGQSGAFKDTPAMASLTPAELMPCLTVTFSEGDDNTPDNPDDIPTVIREILTEHPAPEYYNLQGIRISTPTPGNLYIIRRGNQTTKAIF